jgi:aspartate racemase
LSSRYSGQDDINVGFPIAGRNRLGLEGLIGFFVNILVLRGDLSGNPTFTEFLQRIREATLGAYEHRDVPFPLVVKELQPERHLSYAPLFQVLFALQDPDPIPAKLGGLELRLQYISAETSKFDLSIMLSEEEKGLTAKVQYCTDLFDRDTIQRFLRHFEILLEGIVSNPGTPIRELQLITPAERDKLLVHWNNTSTDYPKKTVAELFEEQAAQRPGAVAVVFGDLELSYSDLNARANQLAHFLKGLGVKPHSLIGFCVENSFELVTTILGILKASCAYVAVEPDIPSKRLQSILEDARLSVLVVGSNQQKTIVQKALVESSAKSTNNTPIIVCLDHEASAIKNELEGNPHCEASSESPAYVCYTSGSTGRPKGVIIPHRGVVRLVKNTNYIAISSSDIFLQLSPVSFDASTFEIWGSLLNGARLVMPPAKIMSPAEIGRTIQKHRVSVLWLTAGLFHLMVDDEIDRLKGVRRLLAGGDVLSVEHVKKALEFMGEGSIVNGYGPTENTTFTCCHSITRSSVNNRSISIGRPISNTQCFIFDGNLMPVPIGVRGELFIGGDGLGCGYLNDATLTSAKFIPNPIRPHSLLYRTGDFARFLSNGDIEFLGRIDHQVKIRGFRVELGEIESVLKLHPAVRECVVLLQERADDNTLVAYVSLINPTDKLELRAFLTEKLPIHMIPFTFIVLDNLPLTANGKVDRKRLPLPGDNLAQTHDFKKTPQTSTEKRLVTLWSEVFGSEQFGIQDNFFELGGTSLMLIRLISKINRWFGVSLSVPEFSRKPTVESLAQIIDAGLPQAAPRVIRLQEGRIQPHVYFIFAGSSEFRLAQAMDSGHPIYGVEIPWRLSWRNNVLPTLEEFVAPYAAAILEHVGSSHSVLVGYSFAGLMAFETAHQIRRQGGNVDAVILLDSRAKHSGWWQRKHRRLHQVLKEPKRSLPKNVRTVRFTMNYLWALLRIGCCITMNKLRILYRLMSNSTCIHGEETLGELTEFRDEDGMPLYWNEAARLYYNATKYYHLSSLDCRGFLFRTESEDQALSRLNHSLGWEGLFARGMQIVSVYTDHVSMMRQEPNIRMLAREIDRVLYGLELKPSEGNAREQSIHPPESWTVASLDSVDRPLS